MAGHIKLDRKIINWEWYQDPVVMRVFLHLLLTANYKDSKWQGKVVKRGQLITGRHKLAETLGITEQPIRTALVKLQSTNEITIEATKQYSIITICKYDSYQSIDSIANQETNQQLTSNQPTTNQQLTTSNKNNKEKKENTSSFSPSGGPFFGLYEKMMVVFMKHCPTYYKEDKKDYPACNIIADKIERLKGWEHGSCMNGGMDAFLEYWDLMAEKASKHKWLGTQSLLKLSDDQWQIWCQHMSNQEKGTSSKQQREEKSKAAKEAKEVKLVNAQTLAAQYDD